VAEFTGGANRKQTNFQSAALASNGPGI